MNHQNDDSNFKNPICIRSGKDEANQSNPMGVYPNKQGCSLSTPSSAKQGLSRCQHLVAEVIGTGISSIIHKDDDLREEEAQMGIKNIGAHIKKVILDPTSQRQMEMDQISSVGPQMEQAPSRPNIFQSAVVPSFV